MLQTRTYQKQEPSLQRCESLRSDPCTNGESSLCRHTEAAQGGLYTTMTAFPSPSNTYSIIQRKLFAQGGRHLAPEVHPSCPASKSFLLRFTQVNADLLLCANICLSFSWDGSWSWSEPRAEAAQLMMPAAEQRDCAEAFWDVCTASAPDSQIFNTSVGTSLTSHF